MKKTFLLLFVVATITLTVGCSNGLPRNCLLRKWFCGKECYEPAVTCYTPDSCSTGACPTCPSSTGVIVGDPILTDSCPSCAAPSLPPAATGTTTTTPSPQPYSYNN